NLLALGQVVHRAERVDQAFFLFALDLFQRPAKVLEVLNPFKVADNDPARVGQDIGDDGDATSIEHQVGLGPGRAVGRLDDQLGLNGLGQLFIEDASQGRGDQDVDRRHQ